MGAPTNLLFGRTAALHGAEALRAQQNPHVTCAYIPVAARHAACISSQKMNV